MARTFSGSPTSPAREILACTPSNTLDFAEGPCRGLLVIVTGDVKYTPEGNAADDPVTQTALPANYYIDCLVKRVWATGTTATVRRVY